jgi:hypothetical protein
MNYADAVKKVKAVKPGENYLLIEFAYSGRFVFPYKDGLTVLAAMENAEKITEEYSAPKRIKPILRDDFNSRILSHQEYLHYKIAALYNISPDEAKAMMEAENNPTPATTS